MLDFENMYGYGYTTFEEGPEEDYTDLQVYFDLDNKKVYYTFLNNSGDVTVFKDFDISDDDFILTDEDITLIKSGADHDHDHVGFYIDEIYSAYITYLEGLEKLQTVHYDRETDSLDLLVRNGREGWKLQLRFPLVAKEGEEDTNYVHFGVITEIRANTELGYRFVTKAKGS